MIDSHDYEVQVSGTGSNTGLLTAVEDHLPELDFASPPEFGGPGRSWSPEHLFVASLATCLMTTFQAMAERSGIEVLQYTDESTGHLQRGDDGLYEIERVTLRPRVVISEQSKPDRALRLLERAEKVCLIGRSVSSEKVLEPRVIQVPVMEAHQVGT